MNTDRKQVAGSQGHLTRYLRDAIAASPEAPNLNTGDLDRLALALTRGYSPPGKPITYESMASDLLGLAAVLVIAAHNVQADARDVLLDRAREQGA